jgi:endonuclease/exonuclease/phosphatase family metal-dependent hydrolase
MKKLFLSFITGTAILMASCSNSLNSSEDNAPEDKSEEVVESSIRVMAYNIHHANPPSKPDYIDIDAIVRVIHNQNPDIVALQEVDVNTTRSGSIDEAVEIASELDMNVFFGKAIDYQGGEYGVAILSKYPLSEEVVHRLPTKAETNGEPRVLATAKVTLPDGTEIRFGSTHLDAQRDSVNRELQINKIVEIASAEKLPFIIAGDFNATPGSEVIRVLDSHFKRTCDSCPYTSSAANPRRTIDFIAYKHPENKFSVESHKVINEKYASDHLPLISVIKY